MATMTMASTAKKSARKSAKRAAIIAMAAAIGSTGVGDMQEAASAAMRDMKHSQGIDAFALSYTWDPFDGFIA